MVLAETLDDEFVSLGYEPHPHEDGYYHQANRTAKTTVPGFISFLLF
ncbi:hypothetical protein [Geotalea toluenoxydans]|nr:hypothetical protein [Geotalea toluenoxydans]